MKEENSVWISWNDEPPVQYNFDSLPELNAFLTGISATVDNVAPEAQFEQFDTATGYNEKYGKSGE